MICRAVKFFLSYPHSNFEPQLYIFPFQVLLICFTLNRLLHNLGFSLCQKLKVMLYVSDYHVPGEYLTNMFIRDKVSFPSFIFIWSKWRYRIHILLFYNLACMLWNRIAHIDLQWVWKLSRLTDGFQNYVLMLVYCSSLYKYPKLWLWEYKNICYSLSPVGTNQTKSIQWGLAILPFLYEWRWCPAVGGSCRIVSTVQQDYDANGFLEIVYSSNIFYFPCQIPLFFYLFNLSFNNFENSTQDSLNCSPLFTNKKPKSMRNKTNPEIYQNMFLLL